MTKKLLLSMLLISALVLSACSGADAGSATQSQGTVTPDSAAADTSAPGSLINVAGSTSVGPLMEELVIAYEDSGAADKVEVQQTGSSAGITATIDGAAEIGMSSRDLKDEELAQGLVVHKIALDGIAVIVNSGNTVTGLTAQEIQDIYSGAITNWNEVGGSDADIIVFSREEGSGTRDAFEELVGLEDITSAALFENSTGAVKTNVSTSPNAIGYISLGSLDDSVAALDVDGTPCTVDNIKAGSYPIARPFLLCTQGEPTGGVARFIDYILSPEGQAVVVSHNYIDVN